MLCPCTLLLEGEKGQPCVSLKAQVLQRESLHDEDSPFATLDQQRQVTLLFLLTCTQC